MSKLVNGTTYEATTPAGVIAALEAARISGQRVRIFYGDALTGCTVYARRKAGRCITCLLHKHGKRCTLCRLYDWLTGG